MNAVIDSGVFIAAWHKGDERLAEARKILLKLRDNEIRTAVITDYVMVEVINFLLRKAGFQNALDAYNILMQSERLKTIWVDRIMSSEIEELFLQYKSLTLTDCSLIALAQRQGIKTVYSFDKGFDKVKGITRLER